VCGLTVGDLDLHAGRCTVEGKGGKKRTVPFSRETKRALYNYLNEQEREATEPLFLSDRGTGAGGAMTRAGLLCLFRRLGKAAGLQGVRCSPHTARHYFAVSYLKAGGNVFSLQQTLGHTHISQTQKYVQLAQADIDLPRAWWTPS
jgi:site-specific recombinase XerD